jgi:3-deoxy-manno-octulosonate cytidylyltransferase (CMP-KDO synthetase)
VKVLIVIPARYSSHRFPGKALVSIRGRPMIQWVWERVKDASVGDVVIATDDRRIKEAARGFGAQVVVTSSGCRSGTDRVAEVARTKDASLIVNIQGDEPLIPSQAIRDVISPLFDDPHLQMSTLASPIGDDEDLRNPDVVKVIVDRKGFALYFSRNPIPYSQDGEGPTGFPYLKHIGVYAYRREFLLRFSTLEPSPLERTERLEQLRALENGYRIRVIVAGYATINVDRPQDVKRVEERLASTHRNFLEIPMG